MKLETKKKSAVSNSLGSNGGTLDKDDMNGIHSNSEDTSIWRMEQMDTLFSTLRSKRMSMSAFHAIIKLYMVTGRNEESLILSTLASRLGITTAAITNVVDSIESLGFAKRTPHPHDRRLISINLTAEGKKFAESFGPMVGHSDLRRA